MIRKGVVTSIDPVQRNARVTFRDYGDIVTATIPYADNLNVTINDMVVVVFFSNNLADGLIIAKF